MFDKNNMKIKMNLKNGLLLLSLLIVYICCAPVDDNKIELDSLTKKLIGIWIIDSTQYNGVIDFSIKGYKYIIHESKTMTFIYPNQGSLAGFWEFNPIDSIFLMKIPTGNFRIKVHYIDKKNLHWNYSYQGNSIVEYMTKQ